MTLSSFGFRAMRTACILVAVAAFPVLADAQDAPQPSPSPAASPGDAVPAATGAPDANAASPTPAAGHPEKPQQTDQSVQPSQGLFGDWDGARSDLKKRGINFFGRYAGEGAANPTGGLQRGTAFSSEVQLGLDVDFNKLNPGSGGGILHFIGTQRFGSSLTANALGNLASVQEIYGDGLTTRLTELDYEQPLAKNAVNVKLGRVIMENDFVAGSTYWDGNLYCFYQANAICGTPVAEPNNSGYGYYPSSEWGIRVKGSPTKNFYVETGAYQVNPTYSQRGHGFDLSDTGDTGTMFPFETGFTTTDKAGNQTGNIRVGAYYDTSNVMGPNSHLSSFGTTTTGAVATVPEPFYRGRSGAYLQFDHLLAGTSLKGERGTAMFFAYQYGDPQTAFFSNFIDAGVVRHGTFASRPDDTLAVGFDYIDVNPRLRTLEAQLQNAGFAVPTTGQEKGFELNYGVQALPWLLLKPGVQYIVRPSGRTDIPDPLVFALTTGITF